MEFCTISYKYLKIYIIVTCLTVLQRLLEFYIHIGTFQIKRKSIVDNNSVLVTAYVAKGKYRETSDFGMMPRWGPSSPTPFVLYITIQGVINLPSSTPARL